MSPRFFSVPADSPGRAAPRRLRAAVLILWSVLALSAALEPAPLAAAPPDAGLVIAAKQNAWATRSLLEEVLKSKSPVYAGDVVNTNPVGRLQILFRDNSALTMAPDTQVTINEYVYAQDGGTGDSAMKIAVARGLTRFMSGDIVKSPAGVMQVETPRAVVGIQGTVVDVGVESSPGRSGEYGGKQPVERYALIETSSARGLRVYLKGSGRTLYLNHAGTEMVVFADASFLTRPLSAKTQEELRAALAMRTGDKKDGAGQLTVSPELLLATSTRDSALSFLPAVEPSVSGTFPAIPPTPPDFSGTYAGSLSGTMGSGPTAWTGTFSIGIGDLGGAFAVNRVDISDTYSTFSINGSGANLAGVSAGGGFSLTATEGQAPWTMGNFGAGDTVNINGQLSGSSMNVHMAGQQNGFGIAGSGTGTKQ